jgi:hypothetical protein
MTAGRRRGALFLALALALFGCAAGVGGGVAARPLLFDAEEIGQKLGEEVSLLAAFQLSSGDPRFGGLSGLALGEQGERLFAVSDRGYGLSARLAHDGEGRLREISQWSIAPLLTEEGAPVSGRLADAEALARDRDGSLVVAFEQIHRLWRYPASPEPFASRAEALPSPPRLERAPANAGLEAIAILPDGRLFLLTEGHYNADGSLKGWIRDERGFAEFAYLPAPGFQPTDSAALAGGDLLVLERRYDGFGAWRGRLKRVRAAELGPGARVTGEEVLKLEPPLPAENFEALAVREHPTGTLVYVVSDDNYHPLQRTLLLQFRLRKNGR